MAKPFWSESQIINQLNSGYSWSGSNWTYGFLTSATWFPYAEKNGFSQLTTNQKATATLAINLWDSLIAPDFSLSSNAQTANVKFANTTTNISYAHAYYPGGWSGAGSIWFNANYGDTSGTNNLVNPTAGKWGFAAYIHEIGHAIGLDHAGEYNGGSPTYANDALYLQDSQQYTIMSYFNASNTGADWVASDGRPYYAQTPMMDDILAIQAIYGVETTTRAGDTTYGFNANVDVWLYDFSVNLHPVVCIFDSGGNDTIDLSGWSYSCTINLEPGSFSSADMMTQNISIARSAWIENAVGGTANDILIGNALANFLNGYKGNDVLTGKGGSDIFFFAADSGADIVTDFTVSGAQADVVDLTAFTSLLGYFDLISLGLQSGAHTVFSFSAGNTLTLQNVLIGNLSAGNFLLSAPPMPNEAPDGMTLSNLSVVENVVGAAFGQLSVSDPNGDSSFSFAVSDSRFVVVGTPGQYQLKLASGVALDYEAEQSIGLQITATDGGGLSYQKDFTLLVTDAGGVTITGTTAANTIDGTRTIAAQGFVSAENDTVYGLGGNDTIYGLGGADSLFGGTGADKLYGGAGNDLLLGGDGNDALHGDDGDDILEGGAGNDTLNGGNGNDTFRIAGALGKTTIAGGGGTDTIEVMGTGSLSLTKFNALQVSIEDWNGNGAGVNGTGSGDTLDFSGLQSLADFGIIDGLGGNDTITGTLFADDIRGGTGNDVLNGGGGNDLINGGLGNDTLTGGAGNDTLAGGGGKDKFVFAAGCGQDTITDFGAGAAADDAINLRGLFTNFSSVLAASQQVGNDVVISFNANDSLVLANLNLASLAANDFTYS